MEAERWAEVEAECEGGALGRGGVMGRVREWEARREEIRLGTEK